MLGVNLVDRSAFVHQFAFQLMPAGSQDFPVEPRLLSDVGPGFLCRTLRGFRHAGGIQIFQHDRMRLIRQFPADMVRVVVANPLALALQLA